MGVHKGVGLTAIETAVPVGVDCEEQLLHWILALPAAAAAAAAATGLGRSSG